MTDFLVSFGGEAVAVGQQVLEIGKTLLTGERDFETHIGVPSSFSIVPMLVRISAGIEDLEDLRDDLKAGLDAV